MPAPIPSHLQWPLQRLLQAFDLALHKTQESTGQLASSALKASRRDELLLTQALLRQQHSTCLSRFQESLSGDWGERREAYAPPRKTGWAELSLVDDSAVDALVAADRIGKALGHSCEWELREVEAFTAALLGDEEAGPDENPLRPQLVARALLATVDELTDQAALRQTLSEELTRALSILMKDCYADIALQFK